MSLYHTASYTTTGAQPSLNMDPSIAPFNAMVAVTVGSTGTYALQYSLDPMTTADGSATWFDSPDLPTGTTASGVSSLLAPVSRVRLNIAANTGTITIQTRQGFTTN